MGLKYILCQGVDWFYLAQDGNKLLGCCERGDESSCCTKYKNVVTSWRTVSFSGRTVPPLMCYACYMYCLSGLPRCYCASNSR